GFGHAMLLFTRGALSVGQVITYMALLDTLHSPTAFSLTTFAQVQLGLASARRLLGIMAEDQGANASEAGDAAPIRGAISFEQVSFAYDLERGAWDASAPSASRALDGITCTIQPGETVAIVGQTGAGKTTLTKLLNRTLDATSGRVLIDDVDVQ